MRCSSRTSAVTAAFFLLFASLAASQTACTAAAFGPVTQDPITVSGSGWIGNNCIIDFGSRHVIVDSTATLYVQNATIICGQFTTQAGSVIQSFQGSTGSLTVTASGTVNVAGAIALSSSQFGGTVTIASGGSLSVSGTIDASSQCGPYVGGPTPDGSGGAIALSSAGNMVIAGPLNAAAHCYESLGGTVSLTSQADIDLSANVDVQGAYYWSGLFSRFFVTAGGNYRHLSGTLLLGSDSALVNNASGGEVAISASGSVLLAGGIHNDAAHDCCECANMGQTGIVNVTAGGPVSVTGGIVNRGDGSGGFGWGPLPGGGLHIASLTSDISVSGAISVNAGGTTDVTIGAYRDIIVAGQIDASSFTACWGGSPAGVLDLSAGRNVLISGAMANNGAFGYWGGPDGVRIAACSVAIDASASVTASYNTGWGVGGLPDPSLVPLSITAGDLLGVHGTINTTVDYSPLGPPSTDGLPAYLTTRLGIPYGIDLSGSTFDISPVVASDPTLLPCLANGTAAFMGASPVAPGGPFILQVVAGPNLPVMVVVDTSLQYLPLGPFGWTQVSLFTPAVVLADPGVIGPSIPGSFTNAGGQWGVWIPTAGIPGLSGLTLYVEAYVIDLAAANGLFHQPPYVTVQFL